MSRALLLAFLCVVGLSASTYSANAALNFNFSIAAGSNLDSLQTTDPTTYNNVVNGFIAAGQRYSARFSDDVTVQVRINFAGLGSGILGSASSFSAVVPYPVVADALFSDQTTADDAVATASLT